MKPLVLAAAISSLPVILQAAPVSVLSMDVTGIVTGLDFRPHAYLGPDDDYTNIYSASLPLSYYGLSGGLFSVGIGGGVSGRITLFEDSVTSYLSLDCAFAQYSFNLCGSFDVGTFTDASGNLVLGWYGGSQYTRIVRDGDSASMIYEDDGDYSGVTTDGIWWTSDLGLTITWDLVVEDGASPSGADIISTPLPSSGILFLGPLAAGFWVQRRQRNRKTVS